ncbi:MAG: hypothetical protein AAFX99_00670 [Myxococcota bacterium]
MPVYPSVGTARLLPPPMPARAFRPGEATIPHVEWREQGGAIRGFARLPTAPFPYEGLPYDDDRVFVTFPAQLDRSAPVPVIVHLHGYGVELERMVKAKQLSEQLMMSGRNAVLIVPQGPLLANSGHFGKLMQPGGFRHLIDDVLALLARDGFVEHRQRGSVIVSAHSGGYQAASRALLHGGVAVDAVFLFDALYGRLDIFKLFVEQGGQLRSLYTDAGGTRRRNVMLRHIFEDKLGIPTHRRLRGPNTRVVIAHSPESHAACVRLGRPLARWLAGSGLPRLPGSPLTLERR